MPKKIRKAFRQAGRFDDALVADLEKIATLVRELSDPPPCSENALALVRVLYGVGPDEWARLASAHGLDHWLAFPLRGDPAKRPPGHEQPARQEEFDPLTGIGNRHLFSRHLTAEVERALHSRGELSLICLDVDDFKRVNDIYGQEYGDIVLKRLAHLLQSHVRRYDFPAHAGGGEFSILLPASSCWTGLVLGNRLLEMFRREVFACNGETFSMTFSAGVSSLALLEDTTPGGEALLKSAGDAMREAKRNGKNTVVLAHSGRMARDRESLVRAQEKRLLISGPDRE